MIYYPFRRICYFVVCVINKQLSFRRKSVDRKLRKTVRNAISFAVICLKLISVKEKSAVTVTEIGNLYLRLKNIMSVFKCYPFKRNGNTAVFSEILVRS